MRKFNYFLLTLVAIIFTSIESSAFTTNQTNLAQVNKQSATHKMEDLQFMHVNYMPLEYRESYASNSVDVIENNLTALYSICVALVLINLIVQIKIIYQMIHLFFQFQKKDEFAKFNFN